MHRLFMSFLMGVVVITSMPVLAQSTVNSSTKKDGRVLYSYNRYRRQKKYNIAPPPRGLSTKYKFGFGASIMTGPAWYLLVTSNTLSGSGSIANNFLMNIDILVGLDIKRIGWNPWLGAWNQATRAETIGMGVRIIAGKGGALYDIHLLKYRGKMGVFRYTGAIGLTVSSKGSGAVFDSQVGLGLGFKVHKNIAIDLDMIDIDFLIGNGGEAMFINSLLGAEMVF